MSLGQEGLPLAGMESGSAGFRGSGMDRVAGETASSRGASDPSACRGPETPTRIRCLPESGSERDVRPSVRISNGSVDFGGGRARPAPSDATGVLSDAAMSYTSAGSRGSSCFGGGPPPKHGPSGTTFSAGSGELLPGASAGRSAGGQQQQSSSLTQQQQSIGSAAQIGSTASSESAPRVPERDAGSDIPASTRSSGSVRGHAASQRAPTIEESCAAATSLEPLGFLASAASWQSSSGNESFDGLDEEPGPGLRQAQHNLINESARDRERERARGLAEQRGVDNYQIVGHRRRVAPRGDAAPRQRPLFSNESSAHAPRIARGDPTGPADHYRPVSRGGIPKSSYRASTGGYYESYRTAPTDRYRIADRQHQYYGGRHITGGGRPPLGKNLSAVFATSFATRSSRREERISRNSGGDGRRGEGGERSLRWSRDGGGGGRSGPEGKREEGRSGPQGRTGTAGTGSHATNSERATDDPPSRSERGQKIPSSNDVTGQTKFSRRAANTPPIFQAGFVGFTQPHHLSTEEAASLQSAKKDVAPKSGLKGERQDRRPGDQDQSILFTNNCCVHPVHE